VVVEALQDSNLERFGHFIDEWFKAKEFAIEYEVPSRYFLGMYTKSVQSLNKMLQIWKLVEYLLTLCTYIYGNTFK